VNRTVRRCGGQTATDVVNGLRLERAALRLRMTTDGILDVALDCGFGNLGHFYRCFRGRFGMTPKAYRLAGRATTGP
jgi:AraC family cel operon transcriptional repressor